MPTLRNVAVRRAFFHNGVFHRLEEVLAFYVARDTNPGKWYGKVGGKVDAFDDLPAAYRKNVNSEPPFGGKPGARAGAEQGSEIGDVIAFLKTLTDADLEKQIAAAAEEAAAIEAAAEAARRLRQRQGVRQVAHRGAAVA